MLYCNQTWSEEPLMQAKDDDDNTLMEVKSQH